MLNCVAITGRLTGDPEVRMTTSGTSVTTLRVAVERNRTAQDGTRETDFLDVVAWRQTAEFIGRYFRKGSMIAVQGSIQTRTYEDRNGNKRTAVEIVTENVSFCGDSTGR